jgi:hypothetical protein
MSAVGCGGGDGCAAVAAAAACTPLRCRRPLPGSGQDRCRRRVYCRRRQFVAGGWPLASRNWSGSTGFRLQINKKDRFKNQGVTKRWSIILADQ